MAGGSPAPYPYYNPFFGIVSASPGTLTPYGGPPPSALPTQPSFINAPIGQPSGSQQNSGAGTAGPAVQAGLNLLPRGAPQERAAVQRGVIAPPVRDDMWRGLRTDVPESTLPQTLSGHVINWDDTQVPGSPAVRRGLLRMADNRGTVDSGNLAAYFGFGVVGILPFDMGESAAFGGLMLLTFGSVSQWGNNGTCPCWLVRSNPLWSPIRDLLDVKSLGLTVTSPSTGTLRVVALDQLMGSHRHSVTGLTLRASRTGFPVDIDGKDDLDSFVLNSKDRASWDGTTTGNLDTTDLAAGVIYVSGWSLGRLGIGERTIAKVTIG